MAGAQVAGARMAGAQMAGAQTARAVRTTRAVYRCSKHFLK